MAGTCQGTINVVIPAPPPGCGGITGDVTGDGNIDSIDVMFIEQAVAGTRTLTECQLRRADINRDGKVDSIDAMFLSQYISNGTCSCPYMGQPINPNATLPVIQ